ncbi:hypothetical protein ACFOY4_09765 [Actinomadura syzygii]|uniref:Uncharacterized protein n=1 Tax=Actinomadura syzygii TaxID=1427538 RepID=A0A5D0UE52_9ACTN|nr:hypothetical protein [Actinomadura syzygii]TYC15895.1 hypothetical protein FXF65_11175 [Actinomadura syzygii]
MTDFLAVLALTVAMLGAAARIPTAAADLLRACLPLIEAMNELRTALTSHSRAVPDEVPTEPERTGMETSSGKP